MSQRDLVTLVAVAIIGFGVVRLAFAQRPRDTSQWGAGGDAIPRVKLPPVTANVAYPPPIDWTKSARKPPTDEVSV